MKEFILLMIVFGIFFIIDVSCAKISSMISKEEEENDGQK